ncbi:MAG: SPOR domain-containing protein [Gemmatimonadaceae bacterium]|nr:SPOR domain-containing protein [Gemmatimonadaceae bacterium]
MRRILIITTSAALLTPVSPARGQAVTAADSMTRMTTSRPRPATDLLFRRARRAVADGNGVAGRALVDSLQRAADPATPAYGDALYWHGALAPTAAEAERDYRRVIVEYPLAYYAEDALLAIAELEQARGDRAGALAHLQRYVKDYPSSAGRGVAALGAARLAFEQRDATLGCSMIAVARSAVVTTDLELRNQVEYHGRQCTASVTTATASPERTAPVTATPASVPPASVRAASAPVASAPAASAPVASAPPASVATSSITRSQPAPVAARPPARPTTPRTAASPNTPAPRPELGRRMYTIQLAAYDTRPPAEQLVRKLAQRNVTARVSGSTKPFRVRLAYYRTRQEASSVVAALKARGIIGFVTDEVPPVDVRTP